MWKCLTCLKTVGDEGAYCPFCGNPKNSQKEKWYFRSSVFVITLLVVGPFALPLYWINPKKSITAKVTVSIVVIAASVILGILFVRSLKAIIEYYKTILSL